MVLQDQRIAFVIKLRKFVELMRRGGEAVHEAIGLYAYSAATCTLSAIACSSHCKVC